MLGDVNGDGRIRTNDVTLLLRYIAKSADLSETQKLAADVNKDGKIRTNDGTFILRYIAKIIKSFEEVQKYDSAVIADEFIKLYRKYARQ